MIKHRKIEVMLKKDREQSVMQKTKWINDAAVKNKHLLYKKYSIVPNSGYRKLNYRSLAKFVLAIIGKLFYHEGCKGL